MNDMETSVYTATANEIHAANVTAGWWDMGVEKRNRGEIMMLIVSELAEAAQGVGGCLMDDKLPHLPMFDVELADTAIRLYDLIGAERGEIDVESFDMWSAGMCECSRHGSTRNALLNCVVRICEAMEHHRKGRHEDYVATLIYGLADVYGLAALHHIDLDDVIRQKREFNAVRPDHKRENRQKPGGKAY